MSDTKDTEYRYADAVLPDGGIHTGVSVDHNPAAGRIEARFMPSRPIDGYEDRIVPDRIAVTLHNGDTRSELKFTPDQWQAIIGLVQELMPVAAVAR